MVEPSTIFGAEATASVPVFVEDMGMLSLPLQLAYEVAAEVG